MPAYNAKQKKQPAPPAPAPPPAATPPPAPPENSQQAPLPNAPQPATPQPTLAMPSVSTTEQNQPPETQPLPSPPPLPAKGPALPPEPETAQNPNSPVMPAYAPQPAAYEVSEFGSTFIPVDSWMYDALLRLYSLGYLDSAFLGMRPWTRLSVEHMLALSANRISEEEPPDSEARQLYEALRKELEPDEEIGPHKHQGHAEFESAYSRPLGIAGMPLRDSFHVGQTIVNDYGRPYAQGFNNISGVSVRGSQGRFSFYYRGEYQHAPGYTGYNPAQVAEEEFLDEIPAGQVTPTIPGGQIPARNYFRMLEGDVSVHFFGTEFSFGKHDEWLGPAYGGAFAWSNNADNVYSFHIDRVEPLYIPLLWHVLGPVRYEFFVGPLQGHTSPNSPWTHLEKFEFRPTSNFEFGFSRTVIWGGKDHQSITLGTFWHSFYSISDTSGNEKNCIGVSPSQCKDPGARFSQFDFSYRVPKLRKWLTWYVDTEVHDDVTPVSAPRRTAFRTGLYLARVPHIPKLDVRVEAVSTMPNTKDAAYGSFMYWETVQKNGYTNKGQIMGDWIGREAKGGQAWLTYHMSPKEAVQLEYRYVKGATNFVPGGTTQNDYSARFLKSFDDEKFGLNGWVQFERWDVPFIKPGAQFDTTMAVQFAWYPKFKKWD
jgi:hypothetical protein